MRYPLSIATCGLLVAATVLFWASCSGDDPFDGGQNDNVALEPTIQTADGAVMVLIRAGIFTMGDPDAGSGDDNDPTHDVFVSDFYIDQTEVTNAQYAAFLEATGHRPPRFWDDPKLNGPNKPVVGVTWEDANAYARWAGKRLPTEAEWEKAARGGLDGEVYPWGSEDPDGTRAVFGGRPAPVEVRSTLPNGYGLYDMAGNVWEWVADYYDPTYYLISPIRDPQGPLFGTERVVRGGSFLSDPDDLGVAVRSAQLPSEANAVTGFRCAKDPY